MAGRMGGEKVTTLNLAGRPGRRRARTCCSSRARCPAPRAASSSSATRSRPTREGCLMATVDVLDAPGDEAGTAELDDAIFGIEPNVPVHAPGRHRPAGRPPVRAPRAPRPAPRCAAAAPSPGSRRAPAAPARARSARRSGAAAAWPSAPSPAATPSAPPRRWCASPCARPCPTGPPTARSWSSTLGLRRPEDQGRHRRAGRPRRRGPGARRADGRATTSAWKSFRNLTDVHILEARRAQRLRRARDRLGRSSPKDTLPGGAS